MTDHACPCCGQTRFSTVGSFEICELCNWEDDLVQLNDPTFAGGANDMSLEDARVHWQATGKSMPPNRTADMEQARALVRSLGK